MGVHSDDDLSLGFADCPIQTRGNNLFRIVDSRQAWDSPFKFGKDPSRSIVAHAIGDQDFHFDLAKFLAKNGIEKRANVLDFIPARDNHRDMHRLALLHRLFTLDRGI